MYARAKYEVDYGYRIYMSDGVKACADTLAESFGGAAFTDRWADIYKPQETRDAETIKNNICDKLDRMRSE